MASKVETRRGVEMLEVSQLRVSALNPRQDMGDLDELGGSLRVGQINALVVYPSPRVEGDFEVLDGHRRLMAARKAGLLSLRCEVVDAPAEPEAIARMLTAGRTGKRLTQTEIAAGVQELFDLGLDAEAVRDRARIDESQLAAFRVLHTAPAALRARADAGQGSLDDAFALAQAREDFADDPETLKSIETRAENAGDVRWVVANAQRARRKAAATKRLDGAGVKLAPHDAGYTGWLEEGATPLDSFLALSDDALVALVELRKGQKPLVSDRGGHGALVWYSKPAKKQAEPKPEPTPEEITAAEAREEVSADLASANEKRRIFLEELFAKKTPLPALTAHKLLVEMAVERLAFYRHAKELPLAAGLLGLQQPKTAAEFDAKVLAPARAAFKKQSWAWLVAWMTFASHECEDPFGKLSQLEGRERTSAQVYLRFLRETFAYEVSEEERRVMVFVAPEPEEDGTAECALCGQTVATTVEWDGVCGS